MLWGECCGKVYVSFFFSFFLSIYSLFILFNHRLFKEMFLLFVMQHSQCLVNKRPGKRSTIVSEMYHECIFFHKMIYFLMDVPDVFLKMHWDLKQACTVTPINIWTLSTRITLKYDRPSFTWSEHLYFTATPCINDF